MKVDAELSHELCTGAEAPAVKLSSVGFVLSLQGPPNNVVSGKVNNVVLAVKNMPNINTAELIAAQKLTNAVVALCFPVELAEERSAALQAIYLRQST